MQCRLTCLPAALKSLQQGLHADGPRFLLSLLQLTPDLAALTGLWDATKDVPISSALLTVLTDVLITVRVACAWHEQPSSDSQTTGEEALTPAQILMLTKTGGFDCMCLHVVWHVAFVSAFNFSDSEPASAAAHILACRPSLRLCLTVPLWSNQLQCQPTLQTLHLEAPLTVFTLHTCWSELCVQDTYPGFAANNTMQAGT